MTTTNGSSKNGRNGTGNKSMTAAYLLWFFLGGFGVHRMYAGKMTSGLVMLGLFVASVIATRFGCEWCFAALGVWWIIDAVMINKWFKQAQIGVQIHAHEATQPMEPPMSNAA